MCSKWLIIPLLEQKSINIWVVNLIMTQLDQFQEKTKTYKKLFDKFQEKNRTYKKLFDKFQ